VTGKVKSVTDSAAALGAAFIAGIQDGISAALVGFWKWLQTNFVDKIPGFVKDLLGIKSPSSVFAEIGRQVVEGLRVGMESRLPSIDDVVASVVGRLGGAGGELDDWLKAAIAVTGVGSDWLSGLRWLAMHESTGNPRAVNPYDVNNILNGPGPHAMGLMQTIPSTFGHYRDRNLPNEIFNPIANAVASINYILERYGSIGNVISGWERRRGYAAGGWAGLNGPELAWLGERGPEYVIPNAALGAVASSTPMQAVSMPIVIGGRTVEELWITGRDLAIRRGRVPGAGAAAMGSLG
jgi:SLT domain-containing protein